MNASLPSAVTPKLAKLIPMLGSDRAGELLAAVYAIQRTLKAAGSDLHAVAAVIERAGRPEGPSRPTWVDHARFCLQSGQLNERELEFVTDMARRSRFKPPSPRQVEWLSALYARARFKGPYAHG